MSFTMPEITYTYDWNIMDPDADGYLPTYEPDEKKVRADLQRPLDQIKDTWNGDLKTQLEAFCNSFGGLIPAGDYDSTKPYDTLSLVWYNGSSYVATEAIAAGEVPGVSAKWQRFGSTLNPAQQTGAVSVAGEAAVKTTVGSSASGQTITASLEGAGSLPLLTETVLTALGLESGQNKLVNLLSLLPTVETGTFTIPTEGPSAGTIQCRRRILFLAAYGTTPFPSTGSIDGIFYCAGGIQIDRYTMGAGHVLYYNTTPVSVSADGTEVVLDKEHLLTGEYRYFAICAPYTPAT